MLSTIVLMTPTPVKAGWELLGGSDKKMYFDPDSIEKRVMLLGIGQLLY